MIMIIRILWRIRQYYKNSYEFYWCQIWGCINRIFRFEKSQGWGRDDKKHNSGCFRVSGKGKTYLNSSPEINLETFDSRWLILNSKLFDYFNKLNNQGSPLGLCRFILFTLRGIHIFKVSEKRWKNKGQKSSFGM